MKAARALVLLACLFPWASLGGEDTLTIASEGARPPFNFLDNNELAGFEIDLGREICARLRRTCFFVTQDWDGLIPGLLAHQYDAVMTALDITDARRAQVAFSMPYVRMPAVLVAQKSSPLKDADPRSLSGKTIGVEDGSASQALLEDAAYKETRVKVFASFEDAMLDLAEGKVDGVIADKLVASNFLKGRREGQCCGLVGHVKRDPAVFGEGIGVAVRKDDVALREAIDAALQAAIDDGTFARIRAKYFDFEIL